MIRLQFSALGDLASRLIEAYGHCPYAHVDTVLADGSLLGARDDVMMGVPAGVQVRPAGYARFTRTLTVELPADEAQTQAYLNFVQSQVGKPYDMLAIAAFALDRKWRTDGSWFCSELVAAGLEKSGVLKWRLPDAVSRIDPGSLLVVCGVLTDLSAI